MSVHFDLPFRITNGAAAVVAQDSDADIRACVRAHLSWRRGQRIDRPALGIDDPIHRQGGANIAQLREIVAEAEPRADMLIDRDPAGFSQLVDTVLIDPRRRQ